ncbi:MAG: aminotransferase class I/II-fold pyridoxal phosphate-dependent enzyme, partial [Clostridia bacterium]|nr:aminotransferase class I/II-fold pyridoxal phosphate-dependent enzyme [Clostridia bacterium]
MSRYMSSRFNSLEAYTPGEQPRDMQYIKLNTNESPYPPSPEVLEAVNRAEVEKLNLYPDPTAKGLKGRLAERYNVKSENIFVSNGSDDILNFAFMAFCDDKKGVTYPAISYGFYPVYADLYRIDSREVPLKEDFSIDPTDYHNTGRMVVIANPNAPTGMLLSVDDIRGILDTNRNDVVLIDEAYIDFGGGSCVELVNEYDNLLVVRTFSKSRCLAGARLGFAIANEGLIGDLEKIK